LMLRVGQAPGARDRVPREGRRGGCTGAAPAWRGLNAPLHQRGSFPFVPARSSGGASGSIQASTPRADGQVHTDHDGHPEATALFRSSPSDARDVHAHRRDRHDAGKEDPISSRPGPDREVALAVRRVERLRFGAVARVRNHKEAGEPNMSTIAIGTHSVLTAAGLPDRESAAYRHTPRGRRRRSQATRRLV